MLKKSFIPGIIFLIFYTILNAQPFNFVRKIDPFPVMDQSGVPYPYPFLGGINAPRPQFVDIDNDGDPDLFLQERASELTFFENIGSATNYQFQWVTNTYDNLDIGEWYRFVDMDGDADLDLLAARPISLMKYFRNEGSIFSPVFVLAADTLRDINGTPIPAEVGSIPVLSDIDADSDPDLFIGRQTGRVTFFRNQGMDVNNLPRFEFVTDSFQGILIIGGGLKGTQSSVYNSLHGANALDYVDIDDDQDFDLFWGDFFSRSIYFLENTGDPINVNLERTNDEYPPTNPLINGGWNIPRFADIDADGDFDLFVGEVGGAFSTSISQIKNFYFYENTGTAQSPSFTRITDQFIVSLDIGKSSIPALVDIDDDGDLDLFIAAEIDPLDPNFSSLHFYENQGTANAPIFKLIDTDYLNLNFGFNYSPTFVDIDADGDQDLFIGKFFGQIYFLENTGTSSSPNFPSIVQNYANIDIGSNATPAFVDIDNDNDYDLFVGEFNGNINFFENTGDSSNANFVAVTDSFSHINVGGKSFPFFTDMDNDGDFDLLCGSQDSGFRLYRNDGSPQAPNFILAPNFNLYSPLASAPILADIDDDSDLDLISGGLGGGLIFYENMDSVNSIGNPADTPPPSSFQLYQNYPNPFNPSTNIGFWLPAFVKVATSAGRSDFGFIELSVYDILGRKIITLVNEKLKPGSHQIQWNGIDAQGNQVSSGVYIYQLKFNSITLSRKMLLIR